MKRNFLNGYTDSNDGFNGCLTPFEIAFDEHGFSLEELREFQAFVTFCLKNKGKKHPERFSKIIARYDSLTESAQDLVLMDARNLEAVEYGKLTQ